MEDRRQKLEAGSWKLEVGSWRTKRKKGFRWKALASGQDGAEDGRQKIEDWRLEIENWKLEVGIWKLEIGNWKLIFYITFISYFFTYEYIHIRYPEKTYFSWEPGNQGQYPEIFKRPDCMLRYPGGHTKGGCEDMVEGMREIKQGGNFFIM